MTFAINVKGGTGAGRKRQKAPTPWIHECVTDPRPSDTETMVVDRLRSLTTYSCGDCGARRPT